MVVFFDKIMLLCYNKMYIGRGEKISMKKVSPIKSMKRELALLGAVVVTALSPMKSEGSVEKQTDIKDIKIGTKDNK